MNKSRFCRILEIIAQVDEDYYTVQFYPEIILPCKVYLALSDGGRVMFRKCKLFDGFVMIDFRDGLYSESSDRVFIGQEMPGRVFVEYCNISAVCTFDERAAGKDDDERQ